MNKADVRAIKTAKSIKEAFFTLLEQKEFEEITVQDILDGAQINRTTFYKHYPNKNILAKMLIEEFKQQVVLPMLDKRFSEPSLQFAQQVSPLLIKNKRTLQLLCKIETPKIHLKQDMYRMIKQRYIDMLSLESLDVYVDLEFQGHIYAILALGTMQFMIDQDKTPDTVRIFENLQLLFDKMIIK
ncbi:hypothetical protein BMT54_00060 [Pasteurellaceae bacterium 15-036681]|nr:hypothetical protein BMT54_00060 [Pasteurellaceae bacterium 15-036681]